MPLPTPQTALTCRCGIERHRLAVLGQVDRQLRHPQDRLVDAHQPMVDGVADAHRQPATDAEIAVQPRVQPGPAVGLQSDHLPAGHEPVGVLFDPQIGAVGVGADDPERPVGRVADRQATSEPARTVKNLPSPGHSSRSESSVNPAALSR